MDRSITKNSIISFIGNIAVNILSFIITFSIARFLGPKDLGHYKYFVLIYTFIISIGALGIGNASVYFINRKKYHISQVLTNLILTSLVWGSFLLIITFSVFKIFPNIVSGLDNSEVWKILIILPFSLLLSYLLPLYLAKLYIITRSVLQCLINFFIVLGLLVLFFINKFNIEMIIGIVFFSTIAASLIILIHSILKFGIIFKYDNNLNKKFISYGLQISLGNIFLLLNFQFDMFLVKYYLGLEQLGFYSIAVALASTLFMITSALGSILYSTWTLSKKEEVDRATPSILRKINIIIPVAILISFICGKFFITNVYGDIYIQSVIPFYILLIGVFFMSMNYVLFNNFSSQGKPILNSIILIISFVINLVLNIIWIPKFGISGAAMASMVSYFIAATLAIIIFSKYSKISISKIFDYKIRDFYLKI